MEYIHEIKLFIFHKYMINLGEKLVEQNET